MGIKEEIFKYLDDGTTTLVFPTENSARHYLCQYVRARGTSVLSSRAIALDTFSQLFSPKHEEKPSNKYHRLAFVASFLDTAKTGLKYLYDDSFFAYRQRFVPFLSRVISQLADLNETDFTKGDQAKLYSDLSILKSQYSEYLKKNNLFEGGWEKRSTQYCRSLKGSYVLVAYDADIQMQRLMFELGSVDNIKVLNLSEVPESGFDLYENEEAELVSLFDSLVKLKKEGVKVQDIAITTPKLSELASRLERKALENDVPLSFVKSIRLSETVPGRYLLAIRRLVNENFSFSSMENLLLNTALPFSDYETNKALILFMIDNNHQSGSLEFKGDRLLGDLRSKAKANEDLVKVADLYWNLKSAIGAIRNANDGDSVIKAIHGLTCLLLGNDEFDQGNEEDRDVYSFIFSELGSINTTLKESNLKMKNIFSIFMSEVESLSYVQQKKNDGIKVYEYGQDYLLDVPYRFIVGLNDSNCLRKSTSMDFLEDFEIQKRQEYDTTERTLDYYLVSSESLKVSGSVKTYSGSTSAPNYFVKKNAVRKAFPTEGQKLLHSIDKESFDYASRTSLAAKGKDVSSGELFCFKDLTKTCFSYSSISNYATCPYKAMLSLEINKDAREDFEPAKQNDRKIGTILHDSIQAFMENHFNQSLSLACFDDYSYELYEIFLKNLESSSFDEYTKTSLQLRYIEPLRQVLKILLSKGDKPGNLDGFVPISNEYKLDKDPGLTGFIDTIVRDLEGNTYLLDYKKGSAPETYQLVLYKRLYDASHPNDEVKKALFYSMKDSKFTEVKKYDELSKQLDDDLKAAKEGYANGLWKANPSKETCSECPERRICRRRFNLQ